MAEQTDDQRAAEPRPVEVIRRSLAQGQQPFSGDSQALLAEYDRLHVELAETRAVLGRVCGAGDSLAEASRVLVSERRVSTPSARQNRLGKRWDRLTAALTGWRSVRGDAPAPAEPPAAACPPPLTFQYGGGANGKVRCPCGHVGMSHGADETTATRKPGAKDPCRLCDCIGFRAPAEPPAVELPVTLSSVDDVAAVCLAHGLTPFDVSPWEEGGSWETTGILVEARDDQTWHITLDGQHGADLDYGYPTAALVAVIDAARGGAR